MKTLISALFVGAIFFSPRAFAQVPVDPVVTVSGQSTAQQTLSVTVSESTSTATVVYTTNGSIPTPSSPTISSGSTILIPQNATLQVQAFNNGSATSASSIITEKYAVAGMVSAGTAHTLFLKNDGSVWASGDNSAGELGNGSTTASSTPVQVKTNGTTNLSGIVAVAAGNDESFAVDGGGHVWAWGLNTNGELGLGNSNATTFATQITAATITGMVTVAASQNHTLALRSDGTVWAWGSNGSGQAGNNTTSAWVTTPVQVLASSGSTALTGIVAVAAGANHSLALTSAGAVFSWGSDSNGQLGDGDASLTSHSLPVAVLKSGVALSNVVALAGGAIDSYALSGNGLVYSWGDNGVGELGNGTTSSSSTVNLSANSVTGLSSAMSAIGSASAYGSSTPYTWGDNTFAELGLGFAGSYATVPVIANLVTGTPPTLTVAMGNNQSVGNGVFTGALEVTATSSGSPVSGDLIDFVVSSGGGLLASSTTSPQLSGIIQVATNSSGQASGFYQNAPSGQGSSQIGVSDGNGTQQQSFTVTTGMAVASSGEPTMPEWMLIIMAGLLIFYATRQRQMTA